VSFGSYGYIDTREILSIYLSASRSGFDTYRFLRMMIEHCSNKPLVLADRGLWYSWALERCSLRRKHVTFGERNPIEQWFGILNNLLCCVLQFMESLS
jgi:transposase-like protein